MSSSIKITCIIHGLGLGGMERVMSNLLNSFSRRDNVEVSLLLIGRFRNIEYEISEKINVIIPDFEFNAENRNLSTFKTMRFIRNNIKEINPTTILCFGEFWNNLVLLSLRGLNYPIYISDRSQPNKNLGKVQNLLRDFLYPKATGYIAQTSKAKEVASKKKWNNNISVIGNPINQVSESISLNKENVVLTVGRLIPTKHIDRLIMIFKNLDNEDWKLVIVGGNSKNMNLLETYRALVRELNLEHRIQVVGSKSNVEDYYKKSKIFAFTSSSEGFPNALGEAMSYGLAVVAYDCVAGPSDMINDGENGYLVPLFDEDKFEKRLKTLMDNQDKRSAFGEKAKQKLSMFDVDEIADEYYRFILNKKITIVR